MPKKLKLFYAAVAEVCRTQKEEIVFRSFFVGCFCSVANLLAGTTPEFVIGSGLGMGISTALYVVGSAARPIYREMKRKAGLDNDKN